MANYICKVCKYSTEKKSNYNRHLNSKKHINLQKTFNNMPKSAYPIPNLAEPIPKLAKKKELLNNFSCKYCGGNFARVNRSRHYSRCKVKQNIETIKLQKKIEKLEEENKQQAEEIRELEKGFIEFMKNNKTTMINNTVNNNDNRQYNMFYIINNYKDAHNIEDLINTPLTDKEKKYIIDNGSTLGCYYILKSRCIDEIDVDKRPFYCIDTSRCKYLLRRKNEWNVDQQGETIITMGCNKVTKKVFFRAKK